MSFFQILSRISARLCVEIILFSVCLKFPFFPAPLPPNNLTVYYPGMPRNSTILVVTWDRPLCDQGVLSGYELCYIVTSVGNCSISGQKVNITGPDTLYYTINDLSIYTNYTVEVRGRTGAGLGEPVAAMNSTDEDGKCMQVFTQPMHLQL